MAKKVDLKAKAKRQKVIAGIGAVLLLGLLAIQVPRTMKMLNAQAPAPPPVEAAPATGAPTDPSVLPTPGMVGGSGGGTGGEPNATLVDSDPAPSASTGQLVVFGRFSSKDPFAQQIDERAPAPDGSGGGGGGSDGGTDGSGGSTPEPAGAGSPGSSPGPTPGEQTPAVPAGSALLALNGAEELVARGAEFPKDEPVFKLVSISRREVKIGVAGGAFASGSGTVTIAVGKTLTLVNTADGTRYEITLVAVG